MRLFLYFCQTIRFEKYDFTKKLFDVLEEKILEEKIYGIFNTDESLSNSPLAHRSLATSARPSDARRRKRRPAEAAKSSGNSAETGSLARTTCVWTTRSVPVTSNSTAPTSRASPADSRSHTRSVAANAGARPVSTRRTSGLDSTSRRSAVSRYRSGAVDHCQTASWVNSPFGCWCSTRRPMCPRACVSSSRTEVALGALLTCVAGCGSCG